MLWSTTDLPDQSGRTIVITGSTAGIGYFAAEQLAAAGAHVVLASRSDTKLAIARDAIRTQVPVADVTLVRLDLGSFASVDRAADEIAALPRLDGVFLNGGSMILRRGDRTSDDLPMLLGTHVIGHVRLLSRILPSLRASAERHGTVARVVHASTGFVRLKRYVLDDVRRVPITGLGAYVKAKTATEVFAFELDRRLRAAAAPVASIVSHPGIGVDAKTPTRAGIRDATTPHVRNPYTPWAQGKDAAAWSAVRAMTDPHAVGGQSYAPTNGVRGEPIVVAPNGRTEHPGGGAALRVWDQLVALAGVEIPIADAQVTPRSRMGAHRTIGA
jgi:NAD(P)-dependent dehydrogenase (short-subunit alcohol dehydrogenase family)